MVTPSRKITLAASVLIALLILGASIYFLLGRKSSSIEQPVEKILRFSYTLTNTSADFIAQAEFLSYLPLALPAVQQIKAITASHDYELVNEDGFHQSIKFNITDLPPYGSRVINVTLELQTSMLPEQGRIKKSVFLKDEKYIEIHNKTVKSLLETLDKAQTPQKSIYQWLANNINDVGYVAENKGAAYALEQRMGDCTEHMYAFTALARAAGIPARGVAGFVVENPAEILTSSGYHNWAEFYDGKKWVLVDSQRRVFDDKYQHYIPFRIFGGEAAGVPTSTNRFLTTDSRISINL